LLHLQQHLHEHIQTPCSCQRAKTKSEPPISLVNVSDLENCSNVLDDVWCIGCVATRATVIVFTSFSMYPKDRSAHLISQI